MYEDCQVMSGMGAGNVVSSETLFSSSIQNPNFNFIPDMSFHPFQPIIKEESSGMLMRGGREMDMESGSGSEQVEGEKSGNEQEISEQQQPPKKKRYHRHTARQIQEMESLFKECPHPDDKQRMKLSQELGLKPRQVKFWFQNRRTQMKAQQDRTENVILRAENESLKNDNCRLQAEMRSLTCPNCGVQAMPGGIPFEELHLENTRLRDELERVYCLASRYTGRPMQAMAPSPPLFIPPSLDLDMNIFARHFSEPIPTCTDMIMPVPMLPGTCSSFPEVSFLLMEEEKGLAMELAMSSMNELVKMCQGTEPLWIIRSDESGKEVLNVEEHGRLFPWPLNNIKQQHSSEFRTEATRDSAVVIMNSINLVDAFLDANKWMDLFPSIVARAKTVQIVTSGVSGASGSLHLMYAELQVLSPLVPTREACFLRYCQQNIEEGVWAIVDFPIDSLHGSIQSPFPLYRRRPSGCIIQDMPNGYSRVTWVEHAEIEEKPVHQIFSQFVHSGTAFGAQRWLAVLQRQCERVASLMARNISDLGVIPSPEARKNLMRLAQRMIRTFSMNISTSSGQSWTTLSDSSDDTVRITTRKITEPGQPNGVILCAVSTTWLPCPHYQVFDLLRDEHRRSQLDLHPNGNALHEVAHIANGSHPGNCISLLRINVSSNSSHHVELMLQESCTDQSGSLVVYTNIDVDSIQLAMSGEDPSFIPLLPLGFVIVPVESTTNNDTTSDGNNNNKSSEDINTGHNSSGCLLTVGMQVLASTIPTAKLNLSSVTAINNHLCNTVHQINAALGTTSTASGGVLVDSGNEAATTNNKQ
ncbi:homeobox-leucine zipper protein HDG5 [Tripterygium wilfordii]|uniref:Homeobox-leucine zipper protein HDG5 n=1 Tax=Tripterygium wilfordii TaxID=458696 RepID=A0A7J7CLY8_TRIWF|nr:homeobox-leucine zipper protein HDG5 [Tripterygium wilfordii]XP_038725205.1 homeobox-leucine zipper protein HDG5 [Tripterygium wilfordii]XP_038725206.1 homeobox-leucine zipper protein HDG5 [Tripterygium wilfordii]XP_038725207.1 homeobox-leucine zipper protein HDG5 [Tripterygium wilfordii]KAF5735049.1 homeobox-leucine zipper protein HDG5 [Tripterygium wilfordii]